MILFLRKLSFVKVLNIIKVYSSYIISIIFRTEFRWGFPISISFEPANFCNLSCPECPVGTGKSHSDKGFSDLGLYKKSVSELSPFISSLILYFQGEPFLNKNYIEMIKFASVEKKVFTISSTNGQFIDKKTAEDIVLAGLDKIIISIDGTTQEIYEKYRVGGNLEKAVNAVKFIAEAKELLRKKNPQLCIQFIVTGQNEHQIPEIKQLAEQTRADKLIFKSAQIYDFKNGSRLIPSVKKYSRYKLTSDGTWHIKSKLKNRCKRLWESAVITNSGKVLPCCFDKSAKYVVGNLNENNFKEINNAERYKQFRKKIISDRKGIEMCRNCTEGLRL